MGDHQQARPWRDGVLAMRACSLLVDGINGRTQSTMLISTSCRMPRPPRHADFLLTRRWQGEIAVLANSEDTHTPIM